MAIPRSTSSRRSSLHLDRARMSVPRGGVFRNERSAHVFSTPYTSNLGGDTLTLKIRIGLPFCGEETNKHETKTEFGDPRSPLLLKGGCNRQTLQSDLWIVPCGS